MPAPAANLQLKPMVLAATNRNPVLLGNGGNGGSVPATVPATVPAPGGGLAMIVGPVERLGIAARDSAVVRRRVPVADGELVQLVGSYFPRSLAEGTLLAERSEVRVE
jgi:hypothetical protein